MPQRTRESGFARGPVARRSFRVAALVGAVVVALVVGATIASGRVAPPARQVDPATLTRIAAPTRPGVAVSPARSTAPPPVEPMSDFLAAEPTAANRPRPDVPQPVGVAVVPTPTPPRPPAAGSAAGSRARASGGSRGATSSVGSRNRVSGTASWYCQTGVSACHRDYPGGFYAAAGPALRVGTWHGRAVRVCGGGGCVVVRLVDWCQCYGSRVIDLYSDAFRSVAPLSSGTTGVTVSW